MGDYKKYLEEDYDGDEQERKRQKDEDNQDAKEAERKIKNKQQRILEESDNQNIMKEYLVHDAQLRCTKGMLNKYKVDDQITITLNKSSAEVENKRLYTNLDVKENPMSVNDNLWYATVKDTIKGQNIIPFRCNCVEKPNRLAEIERIKDNIDDCKENGVCKYLMNLNEEWDNMELSDGDQYLIKKDIKENTDTTDAGQNIGGVNTKIEDVEGITMTSILFCKHGGLIYPVTSGQENIIISLRIGLDKMTQYLRGEGISEEELQSIISWIAQNCGLSINDMIKGQFSKDVDNTAYERSKNYNDQIIAWTYYWNIKIQNEFSSKFTIDPNIVKAIIAQESSFGLITESNVAKNTSRNIMQSLATGNSIVWLASGINPYIDGMFSVGDHISYILLDGTIGKDGALAQDNLPKYAEIYKKSDNKEDILNEERENLHFNDFEIIKNIFEIGDDGKYMVNFNNVTTDMSIATGIGVLANSIEKEGNMYDGVQNYNTLENYVEHINEHLDNMGCEKIEK